jgi:2-iminoacetate synthase
LGRQIDNRIATILREKGLDVNTEVWRRRLEEITNSDVESALSEPAGSYSPRRLAALISPAAENYLEQMAQAAHRLTVQRFGRTIRLYAPLYLSNYCSNSCRYCGFNFENKSPRARLTIEQALEEAKIIAGEGFRDILLVSSEDRRFIAIKYLAELTRRLRGRFGSISIEVYQMSRDEYASLFEAGIEGVTLYQETYDRQAYDYYHPAGAKSDYDDRLTTPDTIAAAGMREVGLGVLLGLTDWHLETLALAEHAHHLMKRYWKSHVSFSFPRLRPFHSSIVGGMSHIVDRDAQFDIRHTRYKMRDIDLVQMITALRLCFADAGLVLSTRENAGLRDNLMKLGITKMSAGSKTNPGGYSGHSDAIEQFNVDDNRSPIQVAAMIASQGFEPVWKDWDRAFLDEKTD